MNPIYKLLGLQSIISKFNCNVSSLGWYKANKQYIADLEISIQASLPDFPKTGGVIVYANHPTGLDPFVISSVLGRDDVYFLGDVYQAKKGKNIARHIIPVYYTSWLDAFQRSGIGFFGYLWMRIMTGTVPVIFK